MSPEIIAVASVGVALAGLILTGQRAIRTELAVQRQEIATLRKDIGEEIAALRDDLAALRERMAHLEGLLEGLREAITRERAA